MSSGVSTRVRSIKPGINEIRSFEATSKFCTVLAIFPARFLQISAQQSFFLRHGRTINLNGLVSQKNKFSAIRMKTQNTSLIKFSAWTSFHEVRVSEKFHKLSLNIILGLWHCIPTVTASCRMFSGFLKSKQTKKQANKSRKAHRSELLSPLTVVIRLNIKPNIMKVAD